MNDPGLEEPIENDAEDVENQKGENQDEKVEEEKAFLKPSRWWFASTAFPLIAGTFGPMASAFSICALAVPWRVYIPPGGAAEQNGTNVPDPKWLVSINAVQLVIALFSNLSLLMNMARRVRFSIAQPITIIGWYISSIVLISLCSMASGPLLLYPRERHAFTGAFYYAMFSATIYFIVASMMLTTVWGAYKGHYSKEFQLTSSQRTLMLQTISFLVYLLSGAAIFQRVEGWTFLEAVYWADYTLLTVGIGDFSPTSHLGRALLFPFAIGGIIILGLVVGSIRSLVLERGKVKLGARMIEKERRKLLKRIEKHESKQILKPITDGSESIPRASTKKFTDEAPEMHELQRREQEFNLMRRIQEEAATKRRWTSLVISGSTWLVLWCAGAGVFCATEHGQSWTYFGSLYFSYTSLLTIGYGDFRPQSNSGKAFFVFWSLLAVPSLTILISNMGDTIIKGIRDLTLVIGRLTVLPGEKGERGILDILKQLSSDLIHGRIPLTHGRRFPAPLTTTGKTHVTHPKSEPTSTSNLQLALHDQQEISTQDKRLQHHRAEAAEKIANSKTHYHLHLAREIADVMTHINAKPARQYSYEEWAWYLKLLGEDEAEAGTHGMAEKRPELDGEGEGEGDGRLVVGEMTEREEGRGKERVKWSWVGIGSPLMGEGDEAQWLLGRLTRRLEGELEAVVEEGERERRRRRSGDSGSGQGTMRDE